MQMLFLGYDPGGTGTHGVAAIHVAQDGQIEKVTFNDVLRDADAVKEWLNSYPHSLALGIDTLLGWSGSGTRRCDQLLRHAYPHFRNTVISQNALYSSMTLNGAMVARVAAARGLPIYESHPKLIIKTQAANDPGAKGVLAVHAGMKAGHIAGSSAAKVADDKADAVLAAWCAAQGWLGRWKADLFLLAGDDLEFFAGAAFYPWPEEPVAFVGRGPREK